VKKQRDALGKTKKKEELVNREVSDRGPRMGPRETKRPATHEGEEKITPALHHRGKDVKTVDESCDMEKRRRTPKRPVCKKTNSGTKEDEADLV